ncbi:MAG: hypothetical protein WAN76_16715, partial [Candidatus Sulfotelmatobacter sp.]
DQGGGKGGATREGTGVRVEIAARYVHSLPNELCPVLLVQSGLRLNLHNHEAADCCASPV